MLRSLAARRARVTSLARCNRYSSWSLVHLYLFKRRLTQITQLSVGWIQNWSNTSLVTYRNSWTDDFKRINSWALLGDLNRAFACSAFFLVRPVRVCRFSLSLHSWLKQVPNKFIPLTSRKQTLQFLLYECKYPSNPAHNAELRHLLLTASPRKSLGRATTPDDRK